MARDDVATDEDIENSEADRSPLSRRTYLRLAGGTAAALAAGSATAAAQSDSYETITVSAGEHHQINVGSGETLENKLIDVTADGASAFIYATGGNWTVRNVGVKGEQPAGDEFMMVCYDDEGGTSRIEHCYFGDGSRGGHSSGRTGCFVHARHSGTLKIHNCYYGNWPDNGVYASPPGNPSCDFSGAAVGQNGTVEVTDSYFTDNDTSNIRLGTTGSFARNCVVDGGAHRGLWSYYETTRWEDCDIANVERAVEVGGSSHYLCDGDVTAVVEDCRSDGDIVHNDPGRGADMLHHRGSLASNPTVSPPEGVPTTAAAAASGASSDAGSGSGSTGDTGGSDPDTTTDDGDATGTVLELISGPNTTTVSYEFTVEGSVSKRTSAGDVAAEGNDSVTDNGDGTMSVEGVAGNGYGDSYLVDGDIVSMDLNESAWTIRYGGEEVSVDDLVLPNVLVIDGTDHPRRASTYTFSVSGTVRKSGALGSLNPRDTVSDGEISGRVIGGKDGYRFSGEITDFSIDGPATVRMDDGS